MQPVSPPPVMRTKLFVVLSILAMGMAYSHWFYIGAAVIAAWYKPKRASAWSHAGVAGLTAICGWFWIASLTIWMMSFTLPPQSITVQLFKSVYLIGSLAISVVLGLLLARWNYIAHRAKEALEAERNAELQRKKEEREAALREEWAEEDARRHAELLAEESQDPDAEPGTLPRND